MSSRRTIQGSASSRRGRNLFRTQVVVLCALTGLGCGGGLDTPEVERRLVVDTEAQSNPTCSGVPPWVRARLKVMPLGDSTTAAGPDGTTYRTFLSDKLNEFPSRQTVDFVGFSGVPAPCCHEGHPGKATAWFTMGVAGWIEVWRPDVVLLMVGTNDQNPAAVPLYMSGIVDAILNQYAGVMIVAAPLIYWGPGDDLRQAFNAALTGAVRNHPEFGKRLRFAEAMATAVAPGPDFDDTTGQNDGIHPGPIGAEKMAKVWHEAGVGVLW